jgi:hypothetical protein
LLTDVQWARIEPLMPSSQGRRGRPFRDHRQVVEGIIHRLRTGVVAGSAGVVRPVADDLDAARPVQH